MTRAGPISLRVRIKNAYKEAGFVIKMRIVMMVVMRRIVCQRHVGLMLILAAHKVIA